MAFLFGLRRVGRSVAEPPSVHVAMLLPDPDAAAAGQLRVVDESGEDYLYPAGYFLSVPLPERVEEALRRTS